MYKATCGIYLRFVSNIVTAVDGPEVANVKHHAALRAVAYRRQKKSAFARLPFERVIKERRVKNRHPAQQEGRVPRDGLLTRRDLEGFAPQPPPRLRHLAIGDEAIVQYDLLADAFGPIAFEVEGIIGGEHARLGHH